MAKPPLRSIPDKPTQSGRPLQPQLQKFPKAPNMSRPSATVTAPSPLRSPVQLPVQSKSMSTSRTSSMSTRPLPLTSSGQPFWNTRLNSTATGEEPSGLSVLDLAIKEDGSVGCQLRDEDTSYGIRCSA